MPTPLGMWLQGRTPGGLSQELFWQHAGQLHPLEVSCSSLPLHINGSITTPAATYSSPDHQYIYINSQLCSCPQIQTLLDAWLQHHCQQQAPGTETLISRSNRRPLPGYLLCIDCGKHLFQVDKQACNAVEVLQVRGAIDSIGSRFLRPSLGFTTFTFFLPPSTSPAKLCRHQSKLHANVLHMACLRSLT